MTVEHPSDTTPPVLTTRDKLAAAIRAEYDKRPPGRYPTEFALADALLASGVVRDPATLADDGALVARVAATDYALHAGEGTGFFDDDWLTETEQHLRALAAAL